MFLTWRPLLASPRYVAGGVQFPSALAVQVELQTLPGAPPVPAGSHDERSRAFAWMSWLATRYVIRRSQPSVASAAEIPSVTHGTTPDCWLPWHALPAMFSTPPVATSCVPSAGHGRRFWSITNC